MKYSVMDSINKLIELSSFYKEISDKFIEMNKEFVFRNSKAEERVKGLIEENRKLTGELDEAIKEIEFQYREKNIHARHLQERTKELEDALRLNSEMDLFVAILAHDLKNPFNVLLNLSELLAEKIYHSSTDDIAEHAKMLNESAHTANDLLDGILMWARNKTGVVPFNPKKIFLYDICRKTLETLSLMAQAKQIDVDCSSDDYIIADPDMIQAIFRNLMTNAIKYTQHDGRIKISSQHSSEDLIISIEDNGIGIDPERLKTLFDISKMKSTIGTEQEKGTGLGLLICKQFIERHGGRLWVESESGKGSKFSFSIPAHVSQSNQVRETANAK